MKTITREKLNQMKAVKAMKEEKVNSIKRNTMQIANAKRTLKRLEQDLEVIKNNKGIDPEVVEEMSEIVDKYKSGVKELKVVAKLQN